MIARLARLALFVLAAFALLLTDVPQAAACSGGDPTGGGLDNQLSITTLAMVGEVIEVDSTGYNGIFHVQSYLIGNGAEYRLISQENPINFHRAFHRRDIVDCIYPLQLPPIGQKSVLLSRTGYQADFIYTFPSETTTINIMTFRQESADRSLTPQYTDFTLNDLSVYIAEHTGHRLTLPELNRPYPLKSSLLIETAYGSYYHFPVDSSTPELIETEQIGQYLGVSSCVEPPCLSVSPNRLDGIQLIPLSSQDLTFYQPHTGYIPDMSLRGHAVSISPTSTAAAVWADDTIELYNFYYPNYGLPNVPEIYAPPVPFNHIPSEIYQPSDALKLGEAAWTRNGRMLAYTDQNGLWLWDVFTIDSMPQLLISASDTTELPYARSFSSSGRYLSVEQGADFYTFDVVSRARHPNGLVSPDEQLLLIYNTEDSETSLSLYSLLRPGEKREIRYIVSSHVRQIEWINNRAFIVSQCYPAGEYGIPISDEAVRMHYFEAWCSVSIANGYDFYPVPYADGYHFDYQQETRQLASIIDDTTIAVVTHIDYSRPDDAIRYRYDLAPYLDSPIVDIQWLPPLFYYEE